VAASALTLGSAAQAMPVRRASRRMVVLNELGIFFGAYGVS
jgi:hypothetical protein